MKANITLSLDIELAQALKDLAYARRTTVSALVGELIGVEIQTEQATVPDPSPYKPPRPLDQYDAMWPKNPAKAQADNPVD